MSLIPFNSNYFPVPQPPFPSIEVDDPMELDDPMDDVSMELCSEAENPIEVPMDVDDQIEVVVETPEEVRESFINDLLPVQANNERTSIDEIKEQIARQKTILVVARVFMLLAAKLAVVVQAISAIPLCAIIAPVLELGRSLDFFIDSIRVLVKLKESRKFISDSGLNEEVRTLCLAKLSQDDLAAWHALFENIGYLTLAVARVVLISAAVAAVIATGTGLAALTALGIGWMVVSNVMKFAIEAYKRPHTTWQNLNGNGLKYFWLNTVVLGIQRYRLEKERANLLQKYVGDSDQMNVPVVEKRDMIRFYEKQLAVTETELKVAELDEVFGDAGMKDADRLKVTETEAERSIRDFREKFTVEQFRGFCFKEKQAFRRVFDMPSRDRSEEEFKFRINGWFAEFSRHAIIDRVEIARRQQMKLEPVLEL